MPRPVNYGLYFTLPAYYYFEHARSQEQYCFLSFSASNAAAVSALFKAMRGAAIIHTITYHKYVPAIIDQAYGGASRLLPLFRQYFHDTARHDGRQAAAIFISSATPRISMII